MSDTRIYADISRIKESVLLSELKTNIENMKMPEMDKIITDSNKLCKYIENTHSKSTLAEAKTDSDLVKLVIENSSQLEMDMESKETLLKYVLYPAEVFHILTQDLRGECQFIICNIDELLTKYNIALGTKEQTQINIVVDVIKSYLIECDEFVNNLEHLLDQIGTNFIEVKKKLLVQVVTQMKQNLCKTTEANMNQKDQAYNNQTDKS